MAVKLLQVLLPVWLWIAEEPEEATVVIVQVFDELLGVCGTLGVGVPAGPGVSFGRHAQQSGAAEHKQWGSADSIVRCQKSAKVILLLVFLFVHA